MICKPDRKVIYSGCERERHSGGRGAERHRGGKGDADGGPADRDHGMRTVDALKPLTAGELLGLWQALSGESMKIRWNGRCCATPPFCGRAAIVRGRRSIGMRLEVLRDLTPRRDGDAAAASGGGRSGSRRSEAAPLTSSGLRRMKGRVSRWTICGSCGAGQQAALNRSADQAVPPERRLHGGGGQFSRRACGGGCRADGGVLPGTGKGIYRPAAERGKLIGQAGKR